MQLFTLQPVRRGDWQIKASILDEQLLIFLYNEITMKADFKVFYSEEVAHEFIERLLNDKSSKTNHG